MYDSVPLNLCGPAFGRPWVDLRGDVIMRHRRHTRLRCRDEGSCSNDENDDEKKTKRGHDDDDKDERKTKRQRKDDNEKDKMS